MKFSSAVDVTQKENRFLRNLTQMLVLVAGVLAGVCMLMFDKAPVMVERTSHGLEIVQPTELLRKPGDVESAVKLMMTARFNSDANAPELFINPKEMLMRDTEQKEMKSRSMNQSVLIRAVHLTKNEATVDIDRLIAIGELRSALKAQVRITFEEVTPNELNPYGLLLSTAEPVQPTTKEEKPK